MEDYASLPCTIEEVVELLSIPVVRQEGDRLVCRCPFCEDRRGHLEVDCRKDVFHCHRCGTGGGVLHLYAFARDVSLGRAGAELREIFQGGGAAAAGTIRPRVRVPVRTEPEMAPAEVRDAAYTQLFARLRLCGAHRTALEKRGMSAEDIAWSGYRTTPAVRRERLAEELLESGCTLEGVPGFYRLENGMWQLDIRGGGILLPDRNARGQIEAVQIRLDDTRRCKYNNLTSRGRPGGTGGHCCPHFVGVQPGAEQVVLTEGILKADLTHRFTADLGCPLGVVGLTGAGMKGQLRRALEELEALGVGKILLAYDMDFLTNDAVAMNRRYALETGRSRGFAVTALRWTDRWKGMDDVLLAIRQHEDAVIRVEDV